MSKIIDMHKNMPDKSDNNPSALLGALADFYRGSAMIIDSFIPVVDNAMRQAADFLHINPNKFHMDFEDIEEFEKDFRNGEIGCVFYYAKEGEIEYCITVVPPEDDDPTFGIQYQIGKCENGNFYIYNFNTNSWMEERSHNIAEWMQKILDTESPEADILFELLMAYDGNIDKKKYQAIKSKHSGLFSLYNQTKKFMEPYYILNDTEKKGVLYLEAKDENRLGFLVGWNGKEYVLYQYIDPLEFNANFDDDFVFENIHETKKYMKEIGRTADIKRIKKCLQQLANRYTEDIVFTIPLSFEVSTEASNLHHIGRKLFFSDGKRRPLNEQEQKSLESVKNYIGKFLENFCSKISLT